MVRAFSVFPDFPPQLPANVTFDLQPTLNAAPPNAERRTPNAERRTPNAERRTLNAER
jgi:hypothetical protein